MLYKRMLGASLSRKAFLAGAVLAALVAIGLSQVVSHVGHQASTAAAGSGRDVGELATPCIGDDGVSLSFAASQQDTGLKVADSAEANSTSLTDVCSAVDASGVVLVYASGVRLAESPNGSADPKTAWQALVDQYPDAGYELTTFDGQPALQISAGGPSTPLGQ